MTSESPIEIVATRGGAVESLHRVHAVAAGPDGDPVAVWGDAAKLIFPRSALKALQALPLVETGAADHFGCSAQELALACASHEGEHFHVAGALDWLQRLGLGEGALACGPQWPRLAQDQAAMIRDRAAPGRAHNNCSGKHTGKLCTAIHMSEPAAGYVSLDHPVQRRVFEAVGAMADYALDATPVGVDGCSAPNPALPLHALASAAARYAEADRERLGAVRAAACCRLMAAMLEAPDMIGGTGRFDTDLICAMDGRVLSKTGAEGVYMLYLPERKLGVALKAEDGAPRASTAAVWSVLERLGELDGRAKKALKPHCRPDILNWDGLVTGRITEAGCL